MSRARILEDFACEFTEASSHEDKLQVCVGLGDDLFELFLINLDALTVLLLKEE